MGEARGEARDGVDDGGLGVAMGRVAAACQHEDFDARGVGGMPLDEARMGVGQLLTGRAGVYYTAIFDLDRITSGSRSPQASTGTRP